MLNSNNWNHLTMCKQMSSGLLKECYLQTIYLQITHTHTHTHTHIYIYIYIYIYIQDSAFNNPQGLICHKTQPNQRSHASYYVPLLQSILCFWICHQSEKDQDHVHSTCDSTAVLAKHGKDSTSNPLIVPLVGYIFRWHDWFVICPHCEFLRFRQQFNHLLELPVSK